MVWELSESNGAESGGVLAGAFGTGIEETEAV
jgi:hypothetical protein